MDGNEISMSHGTQLRGRHTSCEREWAVIKSTWGTVLNCGNDTRAVSENGREWDQHGSNFSIEGTAHELWAGMGGNDINTSHCAQLRGRHTSCERK